MTDFLVALGLVFVAIAVIYVAKTASDLPSFFPGHQGGSTKHHTKHAVAMIGLALLSWIGAWFSTAPSKD